MTHTNKFSITSDLSQALRQRMPKSSGLTRSLQIKRLALELEAAFHEAAQAVIALSKGGNVQDIRIHRTKAERDAEAGSWASGWILVDAPCDYAVSVLAGPIAVTSITGQPCYSNANTFAQDRLSNQPMTVKAAEQVATTLVAQHWLSIECIAAVLLTTRFPTGVRGYNSAQLQPYITHTGQSSASIKATIPQEIHQAWNDIAAERQRRRRAPVEIDLLAPVNLKRRCR